MSLSVFPIFVSISSFVSEFKKALIQLFVSFPFCLCFILIFEISGIPKCLYEGISSPWRTVLFHSISVSFLWVDSSAKCFDLDFLLILTFALWR